MDSQSNNILNLSGIVEESIVDGPGFRYVVFVQGCPHRCKGCHNPSTHSFEGGYKMSVEEIVAQIKQNPLLSGVTFSGGEPFCQPEALCELAKAVKEIGKNIFVYSGYTLEQLDELSKTRPAIAELLHLADTLVDGQYVEELRDLQLQFRGSSNQRIIDLRQAGY